MDLMEFDKSKYLKAADLPQLSQVWTIKDVRRELVGDDDKAVVYFQEHEKGLGLNKVNRDTLMEGCTRFSENWLGKPVEVYKDKTQFQGRVVDCIRCRIISAAVTAPALPQPAAVVAAPAVPQPVLTPQAPTLPQQGPPPPPQAHGSPSVWEQQNDSPPGS